MRPLGLILEVHRGQGQVWRLITQTDEEERRYGAMFMKLADGEPCETDDLAPATPPASAPAPVKAPAQPLTQEDYRQAIDALSVGDVFSPASIMHAMTGLTPDDPRFENTRSSAYKLFPKALQILRVVEVRNSVPRPTGKPSWQGTQWYMVTGRKS